MPPGGERSSASDCSTPRRTPRISSDASAAPARKCAAARAPRHGRDHAAHRRLERDGDRLIGSGTVDMKGGVALALGRHARARRRPESFAEIALLLVNDEEWRTGPFRHAERFAGFDACLCFEAGERDAGRRRGGDRQAKGRGHAARSRRTAARRTRGRRRQGPQCPACTRLCRAADRRRSSDPAGPDRLTRGADDHDARARRSTWSRRAASSTATCARTGSRPSSAVIDALPAEVERRDLEAELFRAVARDGRARRDRGKCWRCAASGWVAR